jgi:hypothetical protein
MTSQTNHSGVNEARMNKSANVIDTSNVRASNRFAKKSISRWLVPGLYILFLMLPIYWLINMSFKTNQEILSTFTLFPAEPTLHNYAVIFTDASWYSGYINSLIYVGMNTVISICVPHCRRPTPSRDTGFSATSTCSSGCCQTGWHRRLCSCCRSSSSIRPLA